MSVFFYVQIEGNGINDALLCSLAWGPSQRATTWPGYFINGYNFQTIQHWDNKATMNSGVCVQGSNSEETCTDFYGLLKDVVQLDYHGEDKRRFIVLFDCQWFDPITGMKVHPIYKLVDVNSKRLYKKFDPFVFAQQVIQVYYTEYPSTKRDKADWLAVCKTKARRTVETMWHEKSGTAFQAEEIQATPVVSTSEHIPSLFDPNGIHLFVDLDELMDPNPEAETDEEDDGQSNEDEQSEDDDDSGNEL